MMRVELALVLGAVALILSGCGGSSSSTTQTTTSTPLPINAPADFVSQIATGKIETTIKVNGTDTAGAGNMSLYLDVEKMSLRLDLTNSNEEFRVSYTEGLLFDLTAKRLTFFFEMAYDKKVALRNCTYLEIAELPSKEFLKVLVDGYFHKTKSSGIQDGFRKFEIHKDLSAQILGLTINGSVDLFMELDNQNGAHKFHESIEIPNAKLLPIHLYNDLTFVADTVQVRTPDASHFQIPKEWGVCK